MTTTLFILLFLFILVLILFHIHWNNNNNNKPSTTSKLPPGTFGWPFIGETIAFIHAQRNGTPEKFIKDRIERYGSALVFKTSLIGHRMAVFCGPEGNKFLFGNENKVVVTWWPETMSRLLGKCLNTSRGDEAKWLRKMMVPCLGPDVLSSRYTVAIDTITRRHIQNHWQACSPNIYSALFLAACSPNVLQAYSSISQL